MPEAKICISVAAASAEDLLLRLGRAIEISKLVEIRFDSLHPAELPIAVPNIRKALARYDGKVIGTYRDSAEGIGGFRSLSKHERIAFWKDSDIRSIVDWIDLDPDISEEEILVEKLDPLPGIIRSYHDFQGESSLGKLKDVVESLRGLGGESSQLIKLAVTVKDCSEALFVWRFLSDRVDDIDVIPIAMGEYGKWTRILAPAFGLPFTFASLDSERSVAPGQVAFQEMESLFRVPEIGPSTEIYGLTGDPVSHSLSPVIHNRAFAATGRDAVYLPLPCRNLRSFYKDFVSLETRLINWNLRGLSVTHPHKKDVVEMVDSLDPSASEVGAVNTLFVKNGKVTGFNTDVAGFVSPLKKRVGDIKGMRAIVAGTGGAALAAAKALILEGASVVLASRSPDNQSTVNELLDCEIISIERVYDNDGFDLAVNATPLGSSGSLETELPFRPSSIKNLQMAYDLVYNPKETRFLRDAAEAGIPTLGGIEMLIEQAALQYEIWTGESAPRELMRESVASHL